MKYTLVMYVDSRVSFTKFLKSNDVGHISINVSKPATTKDQHQHYSNDRKFLGVYGYGKIEITVLLRMKRMFILFQCDKLEVVAILTGYTHNFINTGYTDMVTLMLVNEALEAENPDKYYLEVQDEKNNYLWDLRFIA